MPYRMHDIEEIEGIGKKWGKAFKSKGIQKTEDLLLINDLVLEKKMKHINNFPKSKIKYFVSCAQLMQINGLTGQHAEAITQAGVCTLLKLSLPNPKKLVSVLDEAVKEGAIPESIDLNTAIEWQKKALKITLQNAVHGRIESLNGPVSGATVICQGIKAETDENGYYWLSTLPRGNLSVYATKEGYESSSCKVSIKKRINRRDNALLILSSTASTRSSDNNIVFVNDPSEVDFIKKNIKDFPVQTHFMFSRLYKNGNARLTSLHKDRKGNIVEIGYAEVPPENIMGVPRAHDMLIKINDDTFEISPLSIRDYRRNEYKEKNLRLAKRQYKFDMFMRTIELRREIIANKRQLRKTSLGNANLQPFDKEN